MKNLLLPVLCLFLFTPCSAIAASSSHKTSRGDVILPKVEMPEDIRLPDTLADEEGIQQYLHEIDAHVLPQLPNVESPYTAKRLLGLDIQKPSDAVGRWTDDVAKMLLERGGVMQEGQDKIRKYIELNQEKALYADLHLVVFISNSVPPATIHNLVTQLGDSDNVVFALRGLIGNEVEKIMPTVDWLKKFRCRGDGENAVCARAPIDINPMIYRWLNIERVPAIAYIPDPAALETCANLSPLEESDYLVFYGDVSPAYVLDQFIKARPDDDTLKRIIGQIQPTIWEHGKEEVPLTGAPANEKDSS
jgi:type-F conjugative transfer system pilin assembly protein TrbC